MNSDEFYKAYWAHYISLEKEFLQTCKYVTIETSNYNTFSQAYLKLILGIGSEIDVSMKSYCKFIDASFSGENMRKYFDFLCANNKIFLDQEVVISSTNIIITPWDNKDGSGVQQVPIWWKAYNKCKHDRTGRGVVGSETKEYLRFANLEYTLSSLAALYQLLVFMYKNIADAESNRIKTPLPGSKLFALTGTLWNGIHFYHDAAFYIDDDGCLIYERGDLLY